MSGPTRVAPPTAPARASTGAPCPWQVVIGGVVAGLALAGLAGFVGAVLLLGPILAGVVWVIGVLGAIALVVGGWFASRIIRGRAADRAIGVAFVIVVIASQLLRVVEDPSPVPVLAVLVGIAGVVLLCTKTASAYCDIDGGERRG